MPQGSAEGISRPLPVQHHSDLHGLGHALQKVDATLGFPCRRDPDSSTPLGGWGDTGAPRHRYAREHLRQLVGYVGRTSEHRT
jgi:hypothetical protein